MVIKILFPVLISVLWRAGGTYNTRFRRLGVPIAVFALCLIEKSGWLNALLTASALFGVTSCPITLVGSDIKGNLGWVVLLGYLHGLALLPLFLIDKWLLGIGVAFVLGTVYWVLIYLTVLSDRFKWQQFELAFGFLLGVSVIFSV